MRIEVYAKKVDVLPERCVQEGGLAVGCPSNIPGLGRVVGRRAPDEDVLAQVYDLWIVEVDLPTKGPALEAAMDVGQGCSVSISMPVQMTCSLTIERDEA